MRIQKNGANMNRNVVTTMLWRVVQNYAAFVKVMEMYFYNTMLISTKRNYLSIILTDYHFGKFSEKIEVFQLSNPQSCKDLEDWCQHEPKCTTEDVKTSCPRLCGMCNSTFQNMFVFILYNK